MSDEADAKPPGAEIDEGDKAGGESSPADTELKPAATERDNAENASSDEDQGTKRPASERDGSDNSGGEDDGGSVQGKGKRQKASSSDGIGESQALSLDKAASPGTATVISLQEKWDDMFSRLLRFKVGYTLTSSWQSP
jgi:hypothetical protein